MIVAALIRREGEILLVWQQGQDDPAPSWALPGGMVEPGELLVTALAREVREETGLEVLDPGRVLYLVQHECLDGKGLVVVIVFEIGAWSGQVHMDDPDGLVLEARFVPVSEAVNKLERLPWRMMYEPIVAFLCGEVDAGAAWFYRKRLDDGQVELVARV